MPLQDLQFLTEFLQSTIQLLLQEQFAKSNFESKPNIGAPAVPLGSRIITKLFYN